MISVTPMMQAAAIAFFNSSSPVSFPSSAPTAPARSELSGNRRPIAYTARKSRPQVWLRNSMTGAMSGRKPGLNCQFAVGDTGFEQVASAV
jgi:hypothetical protein